MCSGFPKNRSWIAISLLVFGSLNLRAQDTSILTIAADPNNLPFSNERLEGFENKIAALVAKDLGAQIRYEWRAQRRGFFRETLKSGTCDLVMSAPAGFEMALTTQPYYRSTYVFVSEKTQPLITSLDDPRLHTLSVGVQLIGNDGVDTPPAHALAKRGIVTNVVGFTLYGDYREQNPPARIVEAVAAGEVDIALVWGPLAGYFAKRSTLPLRIVPVTPVVEPPLRYAFSIAMAVRRKDTALRDRLNEIIDRRRGEIDAILAEYDVPCLPIELQAHENKGK